MRAKPGQYNAPDSSGSFQHIPATGARDRPITPFLINFVVVGEIDRPQAIIEPVARKVQTTRENERKETELQLPLKS